jgi:hypothetical protein
MEGGQSFWRLARIDRKEAETESCVLEQHLCDIVFLEALSILLQKGCKGLSDIFYSETILCECVVCMCQCFLGGRGIVMSIAYPLSPQRNLRARTTLKSMKHD